MDIEEAVWHKENTEIKMHEIQDYYNLFNIRPAGEWLAEAKERPAPATLFGDFWREGELSILFSDTNRGKSTLAMQIAESIARGQAIAPIESAPQAQKVLYLDFEMTEKQFESRYSIKDDKGNVVRHHKFSDNLLRAQCAAHDHLPGDFKTITEFVQHSFTDAVHKTGARVVIVDNITFLKGANDNNGSTAKLMRALKHLKEFHNISILVLAHTPKLPYTSPLSINDLHGSKMLSNFADNIFAIGASMQEKDLRYVKHLKQRENAIFFDTSNVILFRIVKAKAFLQFEFVGYANEGDHLVWHREHPDGNRAQKMRFAHALYAKGASRRRIGLILGVAHTTVSRYLQAALPTGETIGEKDLRRLQEEEDD